MTTMRAAARRFGPSFERAINTGKIYLWAGIILVLMGAMDIVEIAVRYGILAESGLVFSTFLVVLVVICWNSHLQLHFSIIPEWVSTIIGIICICVIGTSFAGMLEIGFGSNIRPFTGGLLLGLGVVMFGMFLHLRESEKLMQKSRANKPA